MSLYVLIFIRYLVFLYYFETSSSHIDINNQIDEVDDTQIKSSKLREYFWALVSIMFVSCFSILAGISFFLLSSSISIIYLRYSFFLLPSSFFYLSFHFEILLISCISVCDVLWWSSRCRSYICIC